MINPAPKQHGRLGWQIRWVVGVFSLLMVAAGAIPAYGAESVDPILDARNGALVVADRDERAAASALSNATSELLGSGLKSASDSELDGEETHVSPSPDAPRLPCVRDASFASQHDDRPPRPRDASGRLASRAPPLLA